jgi:casein kinase 1
MVTIAGGRYRILRRVGGGAFGEVYIVQATRNSTHAQEGDLLAAKFEPLKSSHQPHLFHEARVYTSLGRDVTTVGIPRVKWYGVEGDFNVLVVDLVGPSLSELLDFCHGRFSMKTVLMLADQLMCRLQFVHTCGYLHRDLKPDNFAMGRGKLAHHLYMLDFGLAKRYADVKQGRHIPYRDGKSLTGTARYVSLNTHLGIQQSRRDDIEGAAFVLIYLAKGHLPWQNVKCTTKAEKYERIKSMKVSTSPQNLCARMPACFGELLSYARKLDFEQAPDYDYCRRIFHEEMESRGYAQDFKYCWLPGVAGDAASNSSRRSSEVGRNDSSVDMGGSGIALSPRSTRRSDSFSTGFGSPHGSGIFMRRGMRRSSSAALVDDGWKHQGSPGRSPGQHGIGGRTSPGRAASPGAHPLDEIQ